MNLRLYCYIAASFSDGADYSLGAATTLPGLAAFVLLGLLRSLQHKHGKDNPTQA